MAVLEAQDRSEVQALEHKLREQEARYRFLIEDGIDTLDLGVILWDERKRVLWANRAVEDFFGIDRDGLIGLPVDRVRDRIAALLDNPDEYVALVKDAYRAGTGIEHFVTRVRLGLGPRERVIQYRSIPIETARYRGGGSTTTPTSPSSSGWRRPCAGRRPTSTRSTRTSRTSATSCPTTSGTRPGPPWGTFRRF